jgi:carbonic anhydrase
MVEALMFDIIYRFDPNKQEGLQLPKTWMDARDLLVKGNRDFAEMTDIARTDRVQQIIPFDPRAFGWGLAAEGAPVQSPFAAILGCSDARVPTEMVFSKGCNEMFVVRVAGNVLGSECLGSLHYAVHHFPSSLRLLVVLGHVGCGAVTEAVNVYLEPRHYIAIATDHPLRSIADQIFVAVRVAAMAIEIGYGPEAPQQPGYKSALVEVAITMNAAWTAYCLRQEFTASSRHELGVVFGAYDLVSRFVRLPMSQPGGLTQEEIGLFEPPDSAEGFRALALYVCRGKMVQKHLGMKPLDAISASL